MARILPWTMLGAWLVLIFVLSSLSGPQVEELNIFNLWDKAAHFLAFAAGAALLAWALRVNTRWSWGKIGCLSVLAISLFGGSDEWHQLYTEKRSGADVYDWLADTLGAISAIPFCMLIAALIRTLRRRKIPCPDCSCSHG